MQTKDKDANRTALTRARTSMRIAAGLATAAAWPLVSALVWSSNVAHAEDQPAQFAPTSSDAVSRVVNDLGHEHDLSHDHNNDGPPEAQPTVPPILNGATIDPGDQATLPDEAGLQPDPRLVDRLQDRHTPLAERRARLVFHGLMVEHDAWLPPDDRDAHDPPPTPDWSSTELAFDAWLRGGLDHPAFDNANLNPLLKTQWLLDLGDNQQALDLALAWSKQPTQDAGQIQHAGQNQHAGPIERAEDANPPSNAWPPATPAFLWSTHDLVKHTRDAQAIAKLQAAIASDRLGQRAHAEAWMQAILAEDQKRPFAAPTTQTMLGQAQLALGMWEGQPERFQQALQRFGQVQNQTDPLHWPAHLALAKFWLDQSDWNKAVDHTMACLALNPTCAEAWFWLGHINLGANRNDAVASIQNQLNSLSEQSTWAVQLAIETALANNDQQTAQRMVESALTKHPRRLPLLALAAEQAAMADDGNRLQQTLAHIHQTMPGSILGEQAAGLALLKKGMYANAKPLLQKACNTWPTSHSLQTALGRALINLGEPTQATAHFTRAVALNPYDIKAQNWATVAQGLMGFDEHETEHFVIACPPGIDQAFAEDLAFGMEHWVHPVVTQHFKHTPAFKTRIEIMPDQAWFAVRLTGTTEFWTFAAATGQTIVVSPPREGKGLKGAYDWVNVLRHEFTHTVTIDLANQRVPRWFTEGAAVNLETHGRGFAAEQRLAQALQAGELLPLHDINRPFVNPQAEGERQLAYAQGSWLVEHIESVYGNQAIADLHQAFGRGLSNEQAITAVLGVEPKPFMQAFETWAQTQVKAWGLHDHQQRLALQTAAKRALQQGTPEQAQAAVDAYEAFCPHDPWSAHAKLLIAEMLQDTDLEADALAAMAETSQAGADVFEAWANRLTDADQRAQALAAMQQAVNREPYNPTWRERLAVLALQNSNLPLAERCLKANTLLEPDIAKHWQRWAAVLQRLGRTEEAEQANQHAQSLIKT